MRGKENKSAEMIDREAREVARLYYYGPERSRSKKTSDGNEGLGLDEIAHRLGITRSTAFKRLRYARARNIVRIMVDSGRDNDLERTLRGMFDGIGFIVVKEVDNLGEHAALYFDRLLRDHQSSSNKPWTVAIGGGTTIQSMVDALPIKERKLTLLPTMMLGRGPTLGEYVGPVMSLIELRKKSGKDAEIHYASIPPFVEGSDAEAALNQMREIKRHPVIAKVHAEMTSANAIFTSVSPIFDARRKYSPESSTASAEVSKRRWPTVAFESQLIKHDVRTVLDRIGLLQEGALPPEIVGDLSYSFFDRSGNGNGKWELFVCPTIKDYKEAAMSMDRNIVLLASASTPGKLRAVWVALSHQLVNMAILDSTTAAVLANKYRTSKLD